MKILGILGSKNKDGQTAKTVEAVFEGAAQEGSAGKSLFLTDYNISRCRQCQSDGWGKCLHEGKCTVDDDFQVLVEEIRNSDAIVFATPVYYGDLSESMRGFMERLRRTCIGEAGRIGIGGKPAIGICFAGGSGGGATGCAHSLETMISQCGFDIVDMIPAKRQNFVVKQKILKLEGSWLVQSREI